MLGAPHRRRSSQVVVYHGQTRQTARTFSRFKDVATSGVFRGDGKLLAAGCLNGVVQVRTQTPDALSLRAPAQSRGAP